MATTHAHPHPATGAAGTNDRWRPLARHYLEMVAAMLAGMLALGGLRNLAGLSVVFAERPGISFLLMATDMSIGMAAWMLARHHQRMAILEMCAAMYVPTVLLPLLWTGAVSTMTFMALAHVLMMAGMLAVLLRRRAELAHR